MRLAILVCLFAVGCSHPCEPANESPTLEEKEHFDSGLGSSSPEGDGMTSVLHSKMETTPTGYAGGGYSRIPGGYINWGGQAAEPVDVIEATIRRMQHIQGTLSANDRNARALFALMQARDYLTDSQEVIADPLGSGLPETQTEGTEE